MSSETEQQAAKGTPSRGDRPVEGAKVALKILNRRNARCAEDEIAVFERLAAAAVDCRSIVRLYEHFAVKGHVCLAFEMHGEPLYDVVEDAPLTLAEVKSITREIAFALKELHELGFTHTDLKSDNILYGDGTAKLIDFSTADDALRKGETFGTREYRAPEAILGRALGPSVDLWSFACTVFELLTRDYLFDPHGALWARREKTGEGKAEWARMKRAVASEDESSEEDELFGPGVEVGGKYRIESLLGEGHFSKVWQASVLREGAADGTYSAGSGPEANDDDDPAGGDGDEEEDFDEDDDDEEEGHEETAGPPLSKEEERELAKRYDVTLDCELLGLIEGTLGEYPREAAREGKYYKRFFTESGRLKNVEPMAFTPIREVLVAVYEFDETDAEEIEAFLLPLLDYDPARRPSAAAVLEHPWLKE